MKKKSPQSRLPRGSATPDQAAAEIHAFMAEHRLDDLVIESGKERIEVRSGTPSFYAPVSPRPPLSDDAPPSAPVTPPAQPNLQIRTPMAGTFYRSPMPTSEAYVKEGDVVAPGSTVCVIEAMKVMNEIKAEVSGRIVKICVENAASVESGAVLFEVNPAG